MLDEKTNGGVLKIFEENSIEKMIFLLFLEKLLRKIEPWKITSDFHNNFLDFLGGGTFPFSPLQVICDAILKNRDEKIYYTYFPYAGITNNKMRFNSRNSDFIVWRIG